MAEVLSTQQSFLLRNIIFYNYSSSKGGSIVYTTILSSKEQNFVQLTSKTWVKTQQNLLQQEQVIFRIKTTTSFATQEQKMLI